MVSSKPRTGQEGGLSISELADRTGVSPATLRSWEARYGAPRPERLAGGHRRYAEREVAIVEEALRQRASGVSLPSAIERAAARADRPEVSVFAELRRRHPDLVAHALRKTTMLALTRAIEDECCARAERPVLLACFQHPRFYRASERRWTELARTAEAAVVFADFPGPPAPGASPVKVPLAEDAPLLREWALVCDAGDHPACLAGWELPGQNGITDAGRRFEAVWTVDPRAVRNAARACVQILRASSPELAEPLTERLSGTPAGASSDLWRATGLLNRMVDYVERSGRGGRS
ncbi:MAG: DICT sensory domain-containing protein [Acidimicrobiales bacterium]